MALAIGSGLFSGRPWLAYAGAAVDHDGIWSHLGLNGVAAAEPYLLPVCAVLLVAGWHARHDHAARLVAPGSPTPRRSPCWAAPPWPSASPVAPAGTRWSPARWAQPRSIAGGWGRLAGPLVAGTALLVALTISESLSALAGVPTWAWLVGGGAVLLAAGIALERSDTSPVEAGRRIVDVVGESFS